MRKTWTTQKLILEGQLSKLEKANKFLPCTIQQNVYLCGVKSYVKVKLEDVKENVETIFKNSGYTWIYLFKKQNKYKF